MKTLNREDFRKRLDVLTQKFSNSFASYTQLLSRYGNDASLDEGTAEKSGETFILMVQLLILTGLITLLMWSDHYFSLQLVQSVYSGATGSTLQAMAWAIAAVLVGFSVVFVAYNLHVEAEAAVMPGVVSTIKVYGTRLAKFLVPALFYTVVAYTKLSVVWELPGTDAMYRLTQVSGFLGMALVGVLGHLALIVAGKWLIPAVLPALQAIYHYFADEKRKSKKDKLVRQSLATQECLRNLIVGHQRALEAYPEDPSYFQLNLNTKEREYAASVYSFKNAGT